MFGCNGNFYFPEIHFQLTNIYSFDPDCILHSYFQFKSFSEKERERERERGESPDRREREEEERAGNRRGAWSSDEREERAGDRRLRRSSDDRTDLASDLASPARSHLLLHCAISIWPDFRWIFLLGFVSSVSVELSACFVSSLSACLQLRKCVENWSCKAFSVKVFEWAKHRN